MSDESALSAAAPRASGFHADDVESLDNYRSLSVLALVTLVVGLASPLAFTAPIALAIPLLGIALALVALRRIATSEGLLAGRGLAIIGLAFSIASLLAVLSFGQATRFLLVRQAEEFARGWLETVLSGDTRRAFSLTTRGAQPDLPVDQPGTAQQNPYDGFMDHPAIKQLLEVGPRGSVQLESTTSYDRRAHGQCWINQRYLVSPASGSTSKQVGQPARTPFHVELLLQRGRLPNESQSRWLVVSYQDADSSHHSSTGHHGHVH
jgi:hypothetical protein